MEVVLILRYLIVIFFFKKLLSIVLSYNRANATELFTNHTNLPVLIQASGAYVFRPSGKFPIQSEKKVYLEYLCVCVFVWKNNCEHFTVSLLF